MKQCMNPDGPVYINSGLVCQHCGTCESPLQNQVGGDHYKKLSPYQPWQVLPKWLTPEELKGFAKGTAIVYLMREDDKGGREDIRKALHTLELYLEVTDED